MPNHLDDCILIWYHNRHFHAGLSDFYWKRVVCNSRLDLHFTAETVIRESESVWPSVILSVKFQVDFSFSLNGPLMY